MLPSTSGEIPNLPQISSEYKTAQVCPENKNATLISPIKLLEGFVLSQPAWDETFQEQKRKSVFIPKTE